jgi:hypothetical protein
VEVGVTSLVGVFLGIFDLMVAGFAVATTHWWDGTIATTSPGLQRTGILLTFFGLWEIMEASGRVFSFKRESLAGTSPCLPRTGSLLVLIGFKSSRPFF